MKFEHVLEKSKVRQLQIDVTPSIFGVGWAIDAWGGSILLRKTEFNDSNELRRSFLSVCTKSTFFSNF